MGDNITMKRLVTYPKYNREQNGSFKVKPVDEALIKSLYRNGYSINQIAKLTSLSWDTVKRWLDPQYREKLRLKSKIYYEKIGDRHKDMASTNRNFKEKKNRLQPEFKKWKMQQDLKSPYRTDKDSKYNKLQRASANIRFLKMRLKEEKTKIRELSNEKATVS